MYEQITANKRKTFLLFFLFIVLIMGLGLAFDIAFGLNYMGIVIAFIITIVWSLVSYFSGDKIVLKMSGAKEANKREHAHLINSVEGLAIAAGIPKPKVYVIDDPAINAFATGRSPEHSSVAVTSGAIKKLNRQELEGVIAHELSHVKNYDIRTMLLAAVLVGVIALLSDFMIRSFWYGGRRKKGSGSSGAIGIAIGIAAAILAPLIANLIKLSISRKREYLADASGAMLTRYPKGLADALRKIEHDHTQLKTATNATAHLYISNPFKKKGFFVNMFSTHPPIKERIKALDKM